MIKCRVLRGASDTDEKNWHSNKRTANTGWVFFVVKLCGDMTLC